MEITCPSCSNKHRTEDYPGAFEIQCSCGYSILVPDEASLVGPASDDDVSAAMPSFDGLPTAQEHHNEHSGSVSLEADVSLDPALMAAQAQDLDESFSSLNLTAPENLPEGMPYDPFELENQWKPGSRAPENAALEASVSAPASPTVSRLPKPVEAPPATAKLTEAQDIVNRIQMASIGYLHGAVFDLKLGEMTEAQQTNLADCCERLLRERSWLRSYVSKDFDDPKKLVKSGHLLAVPELLAVEIYLHCAQSSIACSFDSVK